MVDDDAQASLPATLTVDGREYAVPSQDDMTLDELDVLEGYAFKNGRESRVGAIRGLIVICKQRAGEQFDEAAIGEIRFGQIKELATPLPPTNRAARRAQGTSGSRG